jgi:hypothetical protein
MTNTWVSVSDTSGNIWLSGHSANGLWNNWISVGSPP